MSLKLPKKFYCGFVLGIILFALGLGAFFGFPSLLRMKILETMVLSEDNAEIFHIWRDMPIPIGFEFRFFNVTNAESVVNHGAKPIVQEVGPYIFREVREKVNITWDDENGTVSYREIKRWYYVDGDLEDQITSINVPFLSGIKILKNAPYLMQVLARMALKKSHLFVTHPVRELLFDGYFEPLLDTARNFKLTKMPSSSFGWFNTINDTDNGLFTVFTGAKDIKDFLVIDKWNGLSNSTFWDPPCNKIEGTVGELWPPFYYEDYLSMHVTDICRSVRLVYEKDETIDGISLRRYVADETLFDNGTLNEQNICFYREDRHFPQGVMEISVCNYDAPAVVSHPHFLMADPVYRNDVEGLHPNITEHQSYLYLEPQMGLPVHAKAKFQMNIYITPDDEVAQLKYVNKTIVFPIFWFIEGATLPDHSMHKLRLTTQELPYYVRVGSLAAIGLTVLIFLCLLFGLYKKRRENGDWDAVRKTTSLEGAAHRQEKHIHMTKISNGSDQIN